MSRVACVALLVPALVLWAPEARAQGAEPAPPPQAAAAQPPAGWPAAQPVPPPATRDKTMMAAGFTVAGIGFVGLVAGVIVLLVGSLHQECTDAFLFPDCHTEPDETAQWVGGGMMMGGVVLLGVGLPIGIIGTKKEHRTLQSWQPSLRIGAGRLDATWRF